MIKFGSTPPLFATAGAGKQLTAPTFTRAGLAYDDAGASVAANTARWSGPNPEPTVNLALYSESFDNAYWGKVNGTITPNATVAPDGTLTADLYSANATNGLHRFDKVTLMTVGKPSTMSIHVKYAGYQYAVIGSDANLWGVKVDLLAGTILTTGANITTATITDVSNGWYRVTISQASVASGGENFRVYSYDNLALASFSGDGVSGVYVWGAQAELLDHPTAYVGTTLGTPRARSILSIDPAANLVTASNDASAAFWTKVNATATANAALAPNGTNTASALIPDATNTDQHRIEKTLLLPNGGPGTISGYFKAGSCRYVMLGGTWSSSYAVIADLQTGTIVYTGSLVTGTITNAGNGWYRVTNTVLALASSFGQHFRVYPSQDVSTPTAPSFFAGDGVTAGLYVWGLQAESTSYPTALMATAGAIAGRAGVPYKNGVIVEEGTTNIVQQSSALDNAYWTKAATTVTADAVIAPDGTLTADKLAEDATTATHCVQKASLVTTTTIYTLSFYAKAAERSLVWGSFNTAGSSVFFDLASGKIGTKGANITAATITPVGGGWYRCCISRDAADAGVTVNVGPTTTDNVTTYAGTAGSGAYFWGVQVEQKAYPTSLVPTSGANGVRAGEALTLPAQGVVRPDQGTVIVRAWWPGGASPRSFSTLFMHATTNNATDTVAIDVTPTQIRGYTQNGSGGSTIAAYNGAPSVGWHNFAVRYGTNILSLWLDGVALSGTTTGVVTPTAAGTITVGNSKTGSNPWGQPIAYLVFYDHVLTDAQMAQATLGLLPPGYTALVDFRGGTARAYTSGGNRIYDPDLFTV